MLFYSGDTDGAVPTYGTLQWMKELVNDLSLELVTTWYPWQIGDGQVAGYYTAYEGITLATVHGAGHMVP